MLPTEDSEFFDIAVEFAEQNGISAQPYEDFGARFVVQDANGRYVFDVEPVMRRSVPSEKSTEYADRVMRVLDREYSRTLRDRRIAMLKRQELFAECHA